MTHLAHLRSALIHGWICIALGIFLSASSTAAGDTPEVEARERAMRSRVVKAFDFDEQKHGNYDAMPMNWRQIVEPGYPRFLEARFDERVGRSAPPAFHFPLRGGHLGAYYLARDIPADPSSAYRITAWVRPRGLMHGGAFVTACYLGQNFRIMPGTERRSEIVRGTGDDEPWVQVTIDLPAGVEHARWIALSCRVEQSIVEDQPGADADGNTWKRAGVGEMQAPGDTIGEAPAPQGIQAGAKPDALGVERIEYHDTLGEAWFDDIAVIRMPRASLTLSSDFGLYDHDRDIDIFIGLEDANGESLKAELVLLDADGRSVDARPIPFTPVGATPMRYRPPPLSPGRYVARLRVAASEHELVLIERAFIRLAPFSRDEETARTAFGVILDGAALRGPSATRAVIDALKPEFVKVPVWRGDMDDRDVVAGMPAFDRLVTALHASGVGLVGLIHSPPRSLADNFEPGRRELFDILAGDAAVWRPYLAFVLTRYGPLMRHWQLGPDTVDPTRSVERLEAAMKNTVAEMRPLIGRARVVVPRSLDREPTPVEGAGDVELFAPRRDQPAEAFASMLPDAAARAERPHWVTIRPLAEDRYERLWRLGDFAKGIIKARCLGADAIFVDMPWTTKLASDETRRPEPAEELLIIHTLGRALASMRPVRRIAMDDGVEAWLFANASRSAGAIVAWSEGWSERERVVRFDLGGDADVIDLWGRRKKSDWSDGGNTLTIGALPIVVTGIDPHRADLAASLSLDDPILSPLVGTQNRLIRLSNPTDRRLRGALRMQLPPGWRCRPDHMRIDLEPGASAEVPVQFALPSNQAEGLFEIVGRLKSSIASDQSFTFRMTAFVATPGLAVDVAAVRGQDGVTVIQRVTNRTESSIDLRSFLVLPDQPRRSQSIPGLPSGETAVRRYVISDDAWRGGTIRVSVEQVGGTLRQNTLLNP